MKIPASRNRAIPASVYDPGMGNPVLPPPLPGEDYSAQNQEIYPKLFQLPTEVGSEVPVFSTIKPHAALDVYFDNRSGVIGGASTDSGDGYEYIFIVYAVIGQITKQVAQGRFMDATRTSFSDGLLVSARCNAQRFLITCRCVRPVKGQVALTGYAYDDSSADPTFQSAPSGYVVDTQFANPSAAGTVTEDSAQVSQFYGFNSGASTEFVRFFDGDGRKLGAALVPANENFSLWFPVPLWFQDGVTWDSSLTPTGGADAGAQITLFTQYR